MNLMAAGSTVTVGDYRLGEGQDLFFILGPCVIESEELTLLVASELARIRREHKIPIIFKASFDKANRTSVESYRGPGLKSGLKILQTVREQTGLPVTSDIHTPDQAVAAGTVLDLIQIPAFLSRQTDLLLAAGRTGCAVNIKKGQFQAPEDMEHAIKKILSTGNDRIVVTERGACFGYNDLVADMRSILRMKRFGLPVVFDSTHSSQLPGRGDACSGGDRSYIAPLARSAVAAGANGIFMEVHPDPDRALCDGPNSLALEHVEDLVINLRQISRLVPVSEPQTAHTGDAMEQNAKNFQEKMKLLRLIVFDVDGVLTDGKITFGSEDLEIKSFNVRDGHGIKIAKRSGLEIAMITGRTSDAVLRRARELGVSKVYQGMKDKRPALAELLKELNLLPEHVAVVGDDIVDIPLMRRAGLAFTVPEAPEEVRREADFVTGSSGGCGVAREILDMVLKAQGKWDDLMARYYA
ncbi:MAG TPA: 3-deoxy-8-phosphooctulonate synthase [Desulfomonilaceae bacterium]|nr:3-deoxy-8-phosphooctulonate synthase [Desulfomonilaceae bacterium]